MFYFILSTSLIGGYKFQLIVLLSLIAIILGIFTIATKSPIYSILYLIGLFLTVSLYLIAHKLEFIGISYILVYVGAISILFLFILMLIDVRISELLTENKNSAVLSILVVIAFSIAFNTKLSHSVNFYELLSDINIYKFIYIDYSYDINTFISYYTKLDVSAIYSSIWDSSLVEISHISAIGNILYSNMFITLMILGVILLLSIVGCIITTVKPSDKSADYINTNPKDPEYVRASGLESGIKFYYCVDIIQNRSSNFISAKAK